MGGGQSKEEQLYQAVQNANHTAVKALRRDGTSLEWADKDGRTPLIMACTKGELFDMVITLLNLGASIKAFRPGSHGGFPLHHAAKRGLEKTVILLLSRGADPLALNDDGQTPIDMARNRGHVSVVRIIEDRICLFSGVLREISGPGFLEALAPQWVTRKVWAVVLPSAQARRLPRQELVIYQSPKVALPRIIIALSRAAIEEPNFNFADPVLILTDKSSKTRFKFMSEVEGRKSQLERFYRACKGLVSQSDINVSTPQESVSPTRNRSISIVTPVSSPPPPPPPPPLPPPPLPPRVAAPPSQLVSSPQHSCKLLPSSPEAEIPEDVALAMAINASIQSANAEGLVLSPTSSGTEDSLSPPKSNPRRRGALGRQWSDSDNSSSKSNGNSSSSWYSPEAGPSRVEFGSRARVENIWQTRPVRNPPVRNVPVRDLGSPTASSGRGSVPIEIYVPQYPPPPPPPASPPPPQPPAPRDTPAPSTGGSETGKSSSFSLFGIKKKALSSEDKAPEEKASGQCVVCWDAPARGVCIPCGHMAGCMNCLMEIKEKTWGCPVCRTPIQQVVKVFTV